MEESIMRADSLEKKHRFHAKLNFEGCGQIYFLTWSKNVSSGWQRVFLYSETYQTAMGDFEASRVTLDASNITSHGLAVLNLKSVSIDDEGTYKCDVTYLQGSCPSLTYTKLFTLGKNILYNSEAKRLLTERKEAWTKRKGIFLASRVQIKDN